MTVRRHDSAAATALARIAGKCTGSNALKPPNHMRRYMTGIENTAYVRPLAAEVWHTMATRALKDLVVLERNLQVLRQGVGTHDLLAPGATDDEHRLFGELVAALDTWAGAVEDSIRAALSAHVAMARLPAPQQAARTASGVE